MFGDRIREARKAKGWNQTQLAEAVIATQQTVSRWEANLMVPAIEKIPAIAKAVGLDAIELVTAVMEAAAADRTLVRRSGRPSTSDIARLAALEARVAALEAKP